jgi:hypothetical protein
MQKILVFHKESVFPLREAPISHWQASRMAQETSKFLAVPSVALWSFEFQCVVLTCAEHAVTVQLRHSLHQSWAKARNCAQYKSPRCQCFSAKAASVEM